MALMEIRFYSEVLGEATSMTVIYPDLSVGGFDVASTTALSNDSDGKAQSSAVESQLPQVLYLLHGLQGDDSAWTRKTALERYVSERDLVVVMPKAGRSFYTNEQVGQRFWDHIAYEVPQVVQTMFRVSTSREDTFVAGLSMGGYGAFKLALTFPERFQAAASLSGALNVAYSEAGGRLAQEVPQVWTNSSPSKTGDDLLHLLDSVDPSALPKLYQACGTEDFLYQDNLDFLERAQASSVEIDTDLNGPGDHDWQYWDDGIRQVLNWLPLRD